MSSLFKVSEYHLSREEKLRLDATRRRKVSEYLSDLLRQATDEGLAYRAALARETEAPSDASSKLGSRRREHEKITKRAYAQAVYRIAKYARMMTQRAMEFWVIADDVVETGLTSTELTELCEVSGWPAKGK